MGSVAVAEVSSRTRTARSVLPALLWVFLALLGVQIYLAGLFMMGGNDTRVAHEALGWSLSYYPFLTIGVALFARMPRVFWIALALLFITVHTQPMLPILSATDGFGWARALHPLLAVLLVVLTFHEARVAGEVKRQTR